MIIEFNITHQNIKRVDGNYLVNLSKNYLKCRFNFTTDTQYPSAKAVYDEIQGNRGDNITDFYFDTYTGNSHSVR